MTIRQHLTGFLVATVTALAFSLVLPILPSGTGLLAQGPGRGGAGQGPGAPGGGAGPGAGGPGGRGGQPPRDNTADPSSIGTGQISGVVIVDGAGTPVRRARVTLSGTALRGGRSVLTDDQGRFAFQALPAGRFTMTASKAGYVDSTYGAKRPGRPGTPIELADGQKLDKANISLPHGSVITGIVVDENGDPSPGTTVRALQAVMRTGEKTLQAAGQDQTDDRGMYRIYQLQPGDYVITATPRNQDIGDLRETIMSAAQNLITAAQTQNTNGQTTGGNGRGAFPVLGALSGANQQQLIDRASQLQSQLAQTDEQQTQAYAPVYFPGTTQIANASAVTLGISEEKTGINFQLQLVSTSRVEGVVVSGDGTSAAGTEVALVPADRAGMASVPGINTNISRVAADGKFSFRNVTPGQYTLEARATVRKPAPQGQTGPQGRGGRGGPAGFVPPGEIAQVLWSSADVSVSGQDLTSIQLTLQPGMVVGGRIEFQASSAQPPTDLSGVRVNLNNRGGQTFGMGNIPPADVDASGRFTITGVPPGKYGVTAGVSAAPTSQAGGLTAAVGRGGRGFGQPASTAWQLKSAIVNGRDVLDFPLDLAPNQEVNGMTLTFTDRTQQLDGTIQDASGRPTSDFTIIVFPSDKNYWLPQARRISSTRPGTDGKFTFRNLPSGDYRLTAVTDVEPGEWYDPAFLSQIVSASLPISLGDGEHKSQDIRVAGGQ